MSYEIRQGYDLKLRGRVSRYRVVRFCSEDELIVHRHHPRRMRPQGRQIKVKLSEVEALCTGLAWDGSGPLWQNILGWVSFPKMPGQRYAVMAPYTDEQMREQQEINALHDMEV